MNRVLALASSKQNQGEEEVGQGSRRLSKIDSRNLAWPDIDLIYSKYGKSGSIYYRHIDIHMHMCV